MLRLASDAGVHGDILRGLRRRLPEIDLVRVQDALPEGTPDPEVLAWAAAENRILLTQEPRKNKLTECRSGDKPEAPAKKHGILRWRFRLASASELAPVVLARALTTFERDQRARGSPPVQRLARSQTVAGDGAVSRSSSARS